MSNPQQIDNGLDSLALRLFVTAGSVKCKRAIENLKQFCEEYLDERCSIQIVDIAADPGIARDYNVFVVPTLMRDMPRPPKRLIGDLSDPVKVRDTLDVG